MLRLFRRNRDDDDDFEDVDDVDENEPRAPAEVPGFAVIVSAIATDGWHMAAVIGEDANPEFYVRALAVRWPFLIARPAPSNRFSDKPARRDQLSPTGTNPARKVVVNWGWVTVEDSVAQLRFYVKRTAPRLFRNPGAVKVRLTLKESAWPRRRIVVAVKSNVISWNQPAPGTPASPPEKSSGTALP
jgi:hypothetical protein